MRRDQVSTKHGLVKRVKDHISVATNASASTVIGHKSREQEVAIFWQSVANFWQRCAVFQFCP